jgi:hypothetical protein
MPRRGYNPNSKYGRRKMRQEFNQRYANMTPAERSENDFGSCVIGAIIIFIVLLIVFLFSGSEGVINYLKRG